MRLATVMLLNPLANRCLWIGLLICILMLAAGRGQGAELSRWGRPFPRVTPAVEVGGAIKKVIDGNVIVSILTVGPGSLPSENRRVVGIVFYDERGESKTCSGLYLDARHVMTAKHCTCHGNEYRVTGTKNMNSAAATWTIARLQPFFQAGAACLAERDFKPREGNDIAILTLTSPLLDDKRRPVDQTTSMIGDIVPLDTWRASGPQEVLVVGYGSTTVDGLTTGTQNQAKMQLNSSDCGTRAAKSLGCRPYREMIIGLRRRNAPPTDACPGDSGGPAFVDLNGKQIPIGLVSRSIYGARPDVPCGDGGIYTLLGRTDVISWIGARLGRD